MDVRMLQSLTFLLTLLPWYKDNRDVQAPLEDLKKERNQKLQSVKNSRMYKLSPHSVLSTISGSLSLPTLTFVVILLLIQTCEGDEVTSSVRPSFRFNTTPAGDDVTSPDLPSVKTTTPPPPGEPDFENENKMMEEETEETNKFSTTEDDMFAYDYSHLEFDTTPKVGASNSTICITREVFYAVIGVIGVFVLVLISTIVYVCRRKNNTVQHTHSKTADQKEELLSAHMEVGKEPKENQRKLQEAQTETAEVRKELQSQLEEVKRKRLENQRKLDEGEKELKNNKEMTKDQKQKLEREIEHCVQQKRSLAEIYTEKDEVLIQIDKLLQAVDTVTKSLSTQQTA